LILPSAAPGAGEILTVATVEGAAMRVTVDPDLCEANGVCANLVPQVFDLDDEDVLHITVGEVPAGLADKVRLAVQSCPKMALSLED